jgi:hypothetical protein
MEIWRWNIEIKNERTREKKVIDSLLFLIYGDRWNRVRLNISII